MSRVEPIAQPRPTIEDAIAQLELAQRMYIRALWANRGRLGLDLSPKASIFQQILTNVQGVCTWTLPEVCYTEFEKILAEQDAATKEKI